MKEKLKASLCKGKPKLHVLLTNLFQSLPIHKLTPYMFLPLFLFSGVQSSSSIFPSQSLSIPSPVTVGVGIQILKKFPIKKHWSQFKD